MKINAVMEHRRRVRDWYSLRRLQLIPDKTELIWFGSRANLVKLLKATRRHESQSLLGRCWASWFRSWPRCYSRQRIIDLSTHTGKKNFVHLLFPSSSFAEASTIDWYSIRTTSHVGFHTVEGWLLQRRARRSTYRHTCTTPASSECCCLLCGRCHIARICQRYFEVITLASDCLSDSLHTLCEYALRSQRNQSVVSNGHHNTDLIIARTSSASFRNDNRIRHSLHQDKVLRKLSLLLDHASGTLFSLI